MASPRLSPKVAPALSSPNWWPPTAGFTKPLEPLDLFGKRDIPPPPCPGMVAPSRGFGILLDPGITRAWPEAGSLGAGAGICGVVTLNGPSNPGGVRDGAGAAGRMALSSGFFGIPNCCMRVVGSTSKAVATVCTVSALKSPGECANNVSRAALRRAPVSTSSSTGKGGMSGKSSPAPSSTAVGLGGVMNSFFLC